MGKLDTYYRCKNKNNECIVKITGFKKVEGMHTDFMGEKRYTKGSVIFEHEKYYIDYANQLFKHSEVEEIDEEDFIYEVKLQLDNVNFEQERLKKLV